MGLTFGFDPTEELTGEIASWYNVDRARVAEVDGQFVATFSAFDLELTVPGARLPMSGVTQVTVAATHRRRGLLRTFMEDHFREVRERGWPVAGLWASEGTIYGRYGYGIAAWADDFVIERPDQRMMVEFATDTSVRFVTATEALEILPRIHASVQERRPGMFLRTRDWWEHRVLRDREQFRNGYTAQRIVVAERDGSPVGYAVYRTKGDLGMDLRVSELFGLDAGAQRALWHYLMGVDLIRKLEGPRRPTDDPLPWWMADPRALVRTVTDTLWLRILDVPAALEGRIYASSGALVLDVVDELAGGRFALEVTSAGRSCTPTDAEADVRIPIDALASLYLGGVGARALHAAGRLEGDLNGVAMLDSLMGWPVAAWCPEIF